MNRSVGLLLSSWSLVVLNTARDSYACGQNSCTITNFPSSDLVSYQVNGLNQAGQVMGFYYVPGVHPSHAFIYDQGLVTDLGTLGGTVSQGFAINAAGQIAGEAALSGNQQMHPFLYKSGALIDLGTLGGATASGSAINDTGDVVGQSTTAGNAATVAFLYSGGSMRSLGTLGGKNSTAVAINDSSVVVGQSTMASGSTHGFIYTAGRLSDLGSLGGDYSSAFALNGAGTVVGESSLANGDVHAFISSGGGLTDMGTLGGTYSSASLINSNGQVIGFASTANDQEWHGFIFGAGTLTDLGTLGGTFSYAMAINNQGQVVGYALTADGTQHAFLWQKGKMADLNGMLPSNSGWELTEADFINDSGRIVGFGTLNGVWQWFILDPGSADHAPVAVAGPDISADCQAQVTLDGSRSSDPDGDPIAFEWSMGGTLLGASSSFQAVFPLGTNVVTLKVTDPCGASSQTNLTVRVTDTAPPTGYGPAELTVAADVNCQARVPNYFSQMVVQDNCTPPDALVFSQNPMPGALVGLGQHPISFTVTDASGNVAAGNATLVVADTTPPVIQSVTANPSVLSPPNHQMVPVIVSVTASDTCDAAPVSKIISITCNQPIAPGEVQISGLLSARLAASKGDCGSGRIYTITVQCTDASGNSSTASVTVAVPHSDGDKNGGSFADPRKQKGQGGAAASKGEKETHGKN